VRVHLGRTKFFQCCVLANAVVKRLGIYNTLVVCLHQHIFLAKHDRFKIGKFCVRHKITYVRRKVPCRTAITVPVVRTHTACS